MTRKTDKIRRAGTRPLRRLGGREDIKKNCTIVLFCNVQYLQCMTVSGIKEPPGKLGNSPAVGNVRIHSLDVRTQHLRNNFNTERMTLALDDSTYPLQIQTFKVLFFNLGNLVQVLKSNSSCLFSKVLSTSLFDTCSLFEQV
jgi:hypothetical protein